jgi:hypothetical protein
MLDAGCWMLDADAQNLHPGIDESNAMGFPSATSKNYSALCAKLCGLRVLTFGHLSPQSSSSSTPGVKNAA